MVFVGDYLKDQSDRIFCIPLNDEEIILLERKVNLIFSGTFRSHLRTLGIYQDIIPELVKTEKEFISLCEDISFCQKENFIPLAETLDGKWLLEYQSDRIFVWEYWIEGEFSIKLLYDSYGDLVKDSVRNIKQNYNDLVLNTEKVWSVQFSISTKNEHLLFSVLGAFKQTDWFVYETSPMGVITSIIDVIWNSCKTFLSKLEYAEWDSPIYILEYEESIEILLSGNSTIKYYDSLLKEKFDGYSLVDYGVVVK